MSQQVAENLGQPPEVADRKSACLGPQSSFSRCPPAGLHSQVRGTTHFILSCQDNLPLFFFLRFNFIFIMYLMGGEGGQRETGRESENPKP